MNPSKKTRVLVVDDSAMVRKAIVRILTREPAFEIVGEAKDPYEAKDMIIHQDPDVITLDIEMPRMDGIQFLKLIMERRPRPVIIVSTLTQAGSNKSVEALMNRAFDVIGKPLNATDLNRMGPELISKVKAASHSREMGIYNRKQEQRRTNVTPTSNTSSFDSQQIILLGASTGGTESINRVLQALPGNMPPIAIVQHIPAFFSKAFAERLNRNCQLHVKQACHGDHLSPGEVLIAPGDYHMRLQWDRTQYRVDLDQGPQVHHQRPAVDHLFESGAKCAGPKAIGVILTGMGKDGAAGLKQLHDTGAQTIGQDQHSCVVYGMPRAAFEAGAVDVQVSLDEVAQTLLDMTHGSRRLRTRRQLAGSIAS